MKNPAFAARGSEVDRQRAYGIAASPPTWSLHLHLSTAGHHGGIGLGAVEVQIMLEARDMTAPTSTKTRRRGKAQPSPPDSIPSLSTLKLAAMTARSSPTKTF